MDRIGFARRWPCIALAAAALGACDHSSVPLPQRKTTPSSELRSEAPAAPSTRDGRSVPAIPPDTATGKAIDAAPGAPARHAALSAADRAFVASAAGAGLYELEGGRLAATKGVSPAVRAFGTMLATQHQVANAELQSLANSHGVALPPRVPDEQRSKLERLSALSGSEFDRAFVQTVGVEDHQAAIEQFATAARDAENPQLREWIQKTLPALQHHLQEAKELVATR